LGGLSSVKDVVVEEVLNVITEFGQELGAAAVARAASH
jgi:hypothetical protein